METVIKIGIIGHGFVGKATDEGFSVNTEKLVVDPKYGTDIQSFSKFNPDFIFICVPTPMKKNGSQDLSIVESVFDELDGKFNHSLIVLKSTILPDFLHF